jgi:hypothetical protein
MSGGVGGSRRAITVTRPELVGKSSRLAIPGIKFLLQAAVNRKFAIRRTSPFERPLLCAVYVVGIGDSGTRARPLNLVNAARIIFGEDAGFVLQQLRNLLGGRVLAQAKLALLV